MGRLVREGRAGAGSTSTRLLARPTYAPAPATQPSPRSVPIQPCTHGAPPCPYPAAADVGAGVVATVPPSAPVLTTSSGMRWSLGEVIGGWRVAHGCMAHVDQARRGMGAWRMGDIMSARGHVVSGAAGMAPSSHPLARAMPTPCVGA